MALVRPLNQPEAATAQSNQDLQRRKEAAVPRGIGVMTQLFVERAEKATVSRASGRHKTGCETGCAGAWEGLASLYAGHHVVVDGDARGAAPGAGRARPAGIIEPLQSGSG